MISLLFIELSTTDLLFGLLYALITGIFSIHFLKKRRKTRATKPVQPSPPAKPETAEHSVESEQPPATSKLNERDFPHV